MSFFRRVLMLPVGSYEFHGNWLPPSMDSIIATKTTDGLAQRMRASFEGPVIELPVMNYGLSAEHAGLPSTAYVQHTTFYTFVYQLLESLATDGDLLVAINGHGGNVNTLNALEADFNYAHDRSKLFFPQIFSKAIKQLSDELFGEFDAHAGSVEASLLAYYRGDSPSTYEIELPRKVRGTFRFFKTSDMTPHGIIKQSPTVIADPALGQRVHDAIVTETATSILRLISEIGTFIEE
jgi:creatinine amidohydrolase/Fe(II)-dependent formamide hydrolase-like protein